MELTLNLRLLWILYRHELRSSLRAKNIVVSSILIPLVLYPVMMWAIFSGITFVQGQQEGQASRLVIVGGEAAPGLVASLEALSDISTTSLAAEDEPGISQAREALLTGSVDGIVFFPAAIPPGNALDGNRDVRVEMHEGLSRSQHAVTRIREALGEVREERVTEAREALDIAPESWAVFEVVREDQSSPEDRTRLLLALMVPIFTVVIVALASFYPAIDTTAGERERSTWETLMTLSVPRRTLVWAKFLQVATLGATGGLLNIVALALSLRWIIAPMAGDDADMMGGPGLTLAVIPVLLLATALLALLVAALMLVFTVFARSFKEGQAMVSPIYMLLILPPSLLVQPDLEASLTLALIPVIGTVLLLREGISGDLTPMLAVASLGSLLVTAILATAFAQWVMGREEVLAGSTEGGIVPFLRRTLRRTPTAPNAHPNR